MSTAVKITFVLTLILVVIASVMIFGERKEIQLEEKFDNIVNVGEKVNPKTKSEYGKYDYKSPYINGFAFVQLNGKQGVVDRKGREITPIIYDGIWYFSEEMNVVETGEKYGFIDTSGKEVIPLQYDFAVDFSDGLASVKKDNKWGYINKKGEVVIPIEYDMAWAFSDHLGCVKKDLKWGFIDKKGKVILPFIYDAVDKKFQNEKAEVQINGKRIFIDLKGNELVN